MCWQHLKLSEHSKHILKTIVIWAVVFIAYGYLLYSLVTMDFTPLLAIDWSGHRWLLLAGCILLMPINMLLESAKWKHLLRAIYPMELKEAQRQVYYGFLGAFITPYRAGDYPSRVLLMNNKEHWGKAIALGVYGSIVMTTVIVLAGLGPFWAYMSGVEPRWWFCLLALVTLCVPHRWTISLFSLLRFVIFSLQLYLLLNLVGIDMSPSYALARIPYYYLLVTITPNIPISDPAIRGSWSIIAFGPMGAVAALALWIVNTLFPLAIGGVISLYYRPK